MSPERPTPYYYLMLGIPPEADEAALEAALQAARARLAAGGDPQAAELERAITVLGDPQRRLAYDELLRRREAETHAAEIPARVVDPKASLVPTAALVSDIPPPRPAPAPAPPVWQPRAAAPLRPGSDPAWKLAGGAVAVLLVALIGLSVVRSHRASSAGDLSITAAEADAKARRAAAGGSVDERLPGADAAGGVLPAGPATGSAPAPLAAPPPTPVQTAPAPAQVIPIAAALAEAPPSEPMRMYRTSYNCGRVTSPSLKLICATPELAAADRELADLYDQALDATSDPDRLAADEQRFIRRQTRGPADPDRLRDLYRERMDELQAELEE